MSCKKNSGFSIPNLPFPYPLRSSSDKTCLPFSEDGFVLINGIFDGENKCVRINDFASKIALIKMGFFGSNTNKEFNSLFFSRINSNKINKELNQSSIQKPDYSNGVYTLNAFNLTKALTKLNIFENNEQMEGVTCGNKNSDSLNSSIDSFHLRFEEAYFLAYIFGSIVIRKDFNSYYNLDELWNLFSNVFCENEKFKFASYYASYHHFRSKGWIVRSGFKFGVDYLLYKEGPPFYHALYSVVIRYISGNQKHQEFNLNELSSLIRVSKNSRKELLLCTVNIPESVLDKVTLNPSCIRDFQIDLVHLNRWNAVKGDFEYEKVFQSNMGQTERKE